MGGGGEGSGRWLVAGGQWSVTGGDESCRLAVDPIYMKRLPSVRVLSAWHTITEKVFLLQANSRKTIRHKKLNLNRKKRDKESLSIGRKQSGQCLGQLAAVGEGGRAIGRKISKIMCEESGQAGRMILQALILHLHLLSVSSWSWKLRYWRNKKWCSVSHKYASCSHVSPIISV